MTTCFAHKNGLISAVEKEDLMRFNIKMHRELHEVSEYYIVDHGANLALINPKGDYHGFIRPPLDIYNMMNIIRSLNSL